MLVPVLVWLTLNQTPDPEHTRTAVAAVLAFPTAASALAIEVLLPRLIEDAHESEDVAIRALEGLWLVEDYAGLDALSAELFADRAFLATRPRLRELVRNLRLQFVRMILHPPGEPLEG